MLLGSHYFRHIHSFCVYTVSGSFATCGKGWRCIVTKGGGRDKMCVSDAQGSFSISVCFDTEQNRELAKQAEPKCAQLPFRRVQECAKVGLCAQRGLFLGGLTRKWSSSALWGCHRNRIQLDCGALSWKRWMERVGDQTEI